MSRKSKYPGLSGAILEMLRAERMENGDRMLSEKQLAQKFGVSHVTVRKALEILYKKGLVHKIASRGTFVGKAPRPKSGSGLVGVLYPEDDAFFHEILSGLEYRMALCGYSPVVHVSRWSQEREKKVIEKFIDLKVDGIVAVPNVGCAEIYRGLDLPVVFFDSHIEDIDVPYVVTDDREGASAAVEHLVSLGHRKIAYIGEAMNDRASQFRKSAYVKVLDRHGIETREKFCLENEYSREWGYNAGRILFPSGETDHPTAAFCGSDAIAAGLISHLNSRGIGIPSEVSVMGFGNLSYSEFLGLSTVDQPRARIAETVWKTLGKLLAGQTVKGGTLIPTSLIVRRTTGKA